LAFTLLELLVAMTITLILAGLMLAVLTNTLRLWQRTQEDFSASSSASLALDLIERDLRAAVFRKDGGTWLACDVIDAPALLAPHGWLIQTGMKPAGTESRRLIPEPVDAATPLIANVRFGLSGAWLRFLSTNVETDGSLPMAVSYQIVRRPVSGAVASSNPAETRYTLFRSAVGSDATFATGNDVTAPGYAGISTTPSASRNPKTLMNPNSSDALATNVVDFGVWLHLRNSDGTLRRIFPADNDDLVHAARDSGGAADPNRFPEVVDVMVRILSDQGADLISEMETGGAHLNRPAQYESDAAWWWGVVESHSRVYVRRIVLRGVTS